MSIRGTMTVRASPVGGDNLQGVKISLSDGPQCASPDMLHGLADAFQFRARGVHETVRRIHRVHDFVDADRRWRACFSHGADLLRRVDLPFSLAGRWRLWLCLAGRLLRERGQIGQHVSGCAITVQQVERRMIGPIRRGRERLRQSARSAPVSVRHPRPPSHKNSHPFVRGPPRSSLTAAVMARKLLG